MMKLMHTREAYGQALVKIGKRNLNIVVLEADISTSTKTCYFARKFPDRFFNVGVAEQNEAMIAAGLASCGKIPFVNTYAVFATMRACEQVRTFICYPRLNVKIVASHGGLTPGPDGVTHQGTEDTGIMSTLPNMAVIVPADAVATKKAVRAITEYDGPVYLRLTRCPVPIIYDDNFSFEIGKSFTIKEGKDVTIIALGDMVSKALEASEELKAEGVETRVIDMHTIKPIDKEAIIKAAEETKGIVTVEDHNIINGLGSAVAGVIVENRPIPMQRVGLKDTFAESGEYEELLNKYGLGTSHIIEATKKVLERKSNYYKKSIDRYKNNLYNKEIVRMSKELKPEEILEKR